MQNRLVAALVGAQILFKFIQSNQLYQDFLGGISLTSTYHCEYSLQILSCLEVHLQLTFICLVSICWRNLTDFKEKMPSEAASRDTTNLP